MNYRNALRKDNILRCIILFVFSAASILAYSQKEVTLLKKKKYEAVISLSATDDPIQLLYKAEAYFYLQQDSLALLTYGQYEWCPKDTNDYHNYLFLLCQTEQWSTAQNLVRKIGVAPPWRSLDSLQKWKDEVVQFAISNSSFINSSGNESSPCFYPNGLLYSADKNRFKAKQSDFYWVRTDDNGSMIEKYRLSRSINSKANELGIAYDISSECLVFGRQEEGLSQLFRSKHINHLWTPSQEFMLNDSAFSVHSPTISKDGKMFIFSSDMPGGMGGDDLYICFKIDSNRWSKPMNLGKAINTRMDEISPFLNENGALFFSSNGHIGYGGFDVYRTQFFRGVWMQPFNLRSPVNSCFDETYFVLSEERGRAYLSSNRPRGKGGFDIYRIDPKLD